MTDTRDEQVLIPSDADFGDTPDSVREYVADLEAIASQQAADTIEAQAAEIERLRAAVAEATCHLSPEGCRLMNAAYSSVNGDGEHE